ncbi:MAG: hypothetical protein AB7U85_11245 [Alphaproteobacteria bacterium]
MIADGINHSVPTEKELRTSLSWLINEGLILKKGRKYKLSEKGMTIYEEASKHTTLLLKIWDNLNVRLTDNDLK